MANTQPPANARTNGACRHCSPVNDADQVAAQGPAAPELILVCIFCGGKAFPAGR
ncbi:MAG: hypothetical protein OEV91_00835 [Desulfobulbaceae bacterium]|nr:hypothetical protein [Desulfobulbaceae bacterium]